MTPELKKLSAYLGGLEPGIVKITRPVEGILGGCWDQFEGSKVEGMEGEKLGGRTENMMWNPPVLSFEIERHGGTVKGSIYAEVHRWELDIKQQTASVHLAKKRQLRPKARRVDMGPIIAEFVDLLQKGQPDARLRWKGPDEVKIDYKSIIPPGNKQQTYDGRKQRFRHGMSAALAADGWHDLGHGLWKRQI